MFDIRAFTLPLLVAAFASPLNPAAAQDGPRSCSDLMAGAGEDISKLEAERDPMREDMMRLATTSPLLVVMSDGSFRFLGSADMLPDAAESWFVSEDVIAKKRQQMVSAQDFIDQQKERECLALFDEAQ